MELYFLLWRFEITSSPTADLSECSVLGVFWELDRIRGILRFVQIADKQPFDLKRTA